MVFVVKREGEAVGSVTVTETPRTVTFEVDCVQTSQELLRCYGVTEGQPLLLGVLEPQAGRLHCTRKFSHQGLAAQCKELPQAYYVSGVPQGEAIPSGDAILDAAIAAGTVRAEKTAQGLRLQCPFRTDAPFALSFAAAGCHIERQKTGYLAVLEWRRS